MEITTHQQSIIPTADREALILAFISSLDVSPSSRQTYSRAIKQFFYWMDGKNYSLSQLTRVEVLEYKDHLHAGRSNLSASAYITALKKFYAWAESSALYPNIARDIKLPKRKQEFKRQPLLPKEAGKLIDYFESKSRRDLALIHLLLTTGLRTIEVVRADIDDITMKRVEDPDTGEILLKNVLMVQGKGKKEKDDFVQLDDEVLLHLQAYLQTRKHKTGHSPLFVSESNRCADQRLTTRTIRGIVKEGIRAIGINHKDYTAHSCRHSCGTNLLLSGQSIETAQRTLRHSNPATTQIYTHTLTDLRRLQNSGESILATLYRKHRKTA